MGVTLEEENIKFGTSKKVFYNPAMQLCRSISSLAVGAIQEQIDVVDAFCASGIRGIRYAKENKNVRELTFIDIDPNAIKLVKKNALKNRLKSAFKRGNISKMAFECEADFLEIDPFGTPSPYLLDAFRFFNRKKSAYLSVTATDVAVLCGGKVAPCMKNYHSKPLNNEFTHEIGLRIMIKKIAEVAAEFNMGIQPLVSFSDKHYLKSVLALKRSADSAYDSLKEIGYISFCPKCGFRSFGQFPSPCQSCGLMEFAGPLWLSDIHEKKFLARMRKLNSKRTYSDSPKIDNMLSLMENEVGMPPYYYNVHNLSRIGNSKSVLPINTIIDKIRSRGYRAFRTHFSPISIKSDAPYSALIEVL